MAKPLTNEEQAQRVLLRFCPWTLNKPDEDESIMPVLPYLGALQTGNSAGAWCHALRAWLRHRRDELQENNDNGADLRQGKGARQRSPYRPLGGPRMCEGLGFKRLGCSSVYVRHTTRVGEVC
eukprot:537953-Amphidinium_carterae.3